MKEDKSLYCISQDPREKVIMSHTQATLSLSLSLSLSPLSLSLSLSPLSLSPSPPVNAAFNSESTPPDQLQAGMTIELLDYVCSGSHGESHYLRDYDVQIRKGLQGQLSV